MTSNLRHTRSTPKGHALPKYACYDCTEVTGAVLKVYRGGYTDNHVTFVCRNGTGCHKADTANDVRGMVGA